MATDDFFRSRFDQMIDLRHPLAVLANRIPWSQIEAALAPVLAHRNRTGRRVESVDLVGAGVSTAGRPRLSIRLMASLLYPTDSRLLEVARHKVVTAARAAGIALKQTFAREGKLYAMHAPEAECIGKGKARQPYEFGVKASVAVTHRQGLIVGARTFPGNPYDGHILAAQLEQTTVLLEDVGRVPKQVVADLGYRGVDADNPTVEIIHRGRYRSMTKQQRRWLKRRQAVEPVIGHLKADHRMNRCWLAGSLGDALHAVLCAAGYNLRWLLRAVARGRIRRLFSPSGRLYCNCYSRFQGCRHRRTGALYRHLRWKSEFCRADELWQQRWQRRGWHGF